MKDQWIKVEDRLPRDGADVLMCWKDEKSIMQGRYFGKGSSLHGFATRSSCGRHMVGKIFVTHWMPLSKALPGAKA